MALLLQDLVEGMIVEKLKDEFELQPASKEEVSDFILNKHYLRRWPSATKKIYKVVNKNTGTAIGCIMYGAPVSPYLWRIFRDEQGQPLIKPGEIVEIQRLFIEDLPGTKNLESFTIAAGNKKIKEELPAVKIISTYADPEAGHSGSIYQATNAIYLGKPKTGKHLYAYVLRGPEKALKQSMAARISDYPEKPESSADV